MSLLSPEVGGPVATPASQSPPAPRRLRLLFALLVAIVYGGAVAWLGLSFEPVKDEAQFWEQVLAFANAWPPDLEALRSYEEPMTPLAFLMWAALEVWLHAGIAAGRLVTIAASLVVLALIALQRPGRAARPETPVLAAVALLLYPYWLPTSLLVYTDVPASLLVAVGFLCYVRERHLAAAGIFALAIATRQYAFTFPVAVFFHEGLTALRQERARSAARRWLPYGLAAASLLGWFAFFGGFGPAPSLEKWPRHTNALATIEPAYALYALAAIGAYFVVLEFVLERRWRELRPRIEPRTAVALAGAVLLFALFTPYYPQQIGLLNRGLNFVFGDGPAAQAVRVALLLVLVCATVARFARPGLGTWVVAVNVAIMPLVWSPWEKYYMPTLVALWFLKAAGALDAPSSRAGPERSASAAPVS